MLQRRARLCFQHEAVKIAGIYALFATAWIFFSDRILAALVGNLATLTLLQTFKGWFFVAVTTVLVYSLVYRHVARLRHAERELLASEERYRELVEGTDDLIVEVDDAGRFSFVNHRSSHYYGVEPAACIGLFAFDFVHRDDQERTRAWFAHCLSQMVRSDSIENVQVARNGRETPMLWTVNFNYFPDGRLKRVGSIARDISEQKAAEQALRDHLRMKSQFVSTAAHELRTPLATIMGYSELLLDDIVGASTSPQEQREFIATILDRTEVLTRIVDELLDLSRIEAGHKIPLKIESCNLDSIVAEALADFSTRFPSHIFEQLPATGDACTCQVDPVRIRQVIDNLMDNAVKYSSSTGVIRLGCGISDEHCRLLVSDNGIGLTPEQQARIFDEFYRVDASNTAVGGLGLGLSIVREIVAGHGGQVQVESEVGKGTILTIILPRRLPIVD